MLLYLYEYDLPGAVRTLADFSQKAALLNLPDSSHLYGLNLKSLAAPKRFTCWFCPPGPLLSAVDGHDSLDALLVIRRFC